MKYLATIALTALCGTMFCLSGCAVGRTNTGGIVFGPELGVLADSINEAAGSLVDAGLTALGIGIPGVGTLAAMGIGWARSHAQARAVAARKEGEDHGWDARERAAGTQQPLSPAGAAPVPAGAGGASVATT